MEGGEGWGRERRGTSDGFLEPPRLVGEGRETGHKKRKAACGGRGERGPSKHRFINL